MGLADAPIIASRTEGTVFVVEARASAARMARTRARAPRQAGGAAGTILTKFEAKQHFGYGYDYTQAMGADGEKRAHERRRRRSGAVRLRLSRGMMARLVPALLFAIATGWLLVVVSGANIVREVRPDLALGMMPFDARAKAKSAERLSASPRATPAQLREARRLATEALDRDPTIASAWRTLGLVSTLRNRPGAAAGFFHTSERISRRDVPTQLWLIEEAVARNNIPAVLHHYDVALRTSRASHPLLLLILIAATARRRRAQSGACCGLGRHGRRLSIKPADQPPPGTNFSSSCGSCGTPEPLTPAMMARWSRLVDTQLRLRL